MKELQSSMDEKFKQVMKKFDDLRASNGRGLELISEMKILVSDSEEIKAATDVNQGNGVAHKVFDERSTRSISNRKVLIFCYNQDEDCLYVETFEFVQKKLLISDFSQTEDCLCVETCENVAEITFLELPKENKKNMVDWVLVRNKITKEGVFTLKLHIKCLMNCLRKIIWSTHLWL